MAAVGRDAATFRRHHRSVEDTFDETEAMRRNCRRFGRSHAAKFSSKTIAINDIFDRFDLLFFLSQGLTCILQISTRGEDFIVDTLALRDDLQMLNELFTDPKIVKVLHGAIADIRSLQRDLSVYVVNMFDTYEAAKELGLKSLQLLGLVDKYCNVRLDKDRSLRMSDWRTRPLTDQQLLYARQDTHYLLYVYDVMKNALLDVGYVTTTNVYFTSQNTCKIVYEKPKPTQSMVLYKRTGKRLDDIQFKVFDALVDWRDHMARECDESLEYCLPMATLVKLAETMPTTERELLDCCDQPFVPNMVKRFARQIVNLINRKSA